MLHKHLIVRCNIAKSPTHLEIEQVNGWLRKLVKTLNMKILLGPYSTYCHVIGNRGMTTICAIETSSITMHIWDEGEAPLLQLDVYSCSNIDVSAVLSMVYLQFGNWTNLKYMFIDRDHPKEGLKLLKQHHE